VQSAAGTVFGSRIRVVTSGGETLTRVLSSRSGFFSQSSRTLHFGLGDATVGRLEVVRPDGTELTIEDVPTDRHLRVAADGSVEAVPIADGGC
jgi:hypothetical protein